MSENAKITLLVIGCVLIGPVAAAFAGLLSFVASLFLSGAGFGSVYAFVCIAYAFAGCWAFMRAISWADPSNGKGRLVALVAFGVGVLSFIATSVKLHWFLTTPIRFG